VTSWPWGKTTMMAGGSGSGGVSATATPPPSPRGFAFPLAQRGDFPLLLLRPARRVRVRAEMRLRHRRPDHRPCHGSSVRCAPADLSFGPSTDQKEVMIGQSRSVHGSLSDPACSLRNGN
jgi:hypothetical protein